MIFKPVGASNRKNRWMTGMMALLGAVAVFVLGLGVWTVWGASNLHYDVTSSHVFIKFGFKEVEIGRDEISQISIVEGPTRARRLVGTSITGLKQGLWSFQETGRINLYATKYDSLVVIETEEGKWGINPDDVEGFIAAVENGASGRFEPVTVPVSAGIIVPIVIIVISLGGAFSVFVYYSRLPGKLAYELGPDALRIHGTARPKAIPYRSIDSVSIEDPRGMPLRVWGAALPGFYWGSFSWKAVGPGLKLCATRLKPLVVVRAGRQTYGLTPEDDKGFVEQLERKLKGR